MLGEKLDTIFNLPGQYDRLAEGLKTRWQEDLKHFGLWLFGLYLNAITPPPEVQKAIDDKSRLGVFDDLNQLLKMKTAQAQTTGRPFELPRLPDSFHPVTLPAEEAREGVPLIWSSLTRDPEALSDLTSGSLAEGCRTDLLFIPFFWTPLELVQPQVKPGASRSALNWTKYIYR